MQSADLTFPKKWIHAIFLFVSLANIGIGLLLERISRNWVLSNWLTNYEGGFVRRGLPGQVAYSLGHVLHITPVFFVVALYFGFYAIFLYSSWKLAAASSRNFWIMALLLSPATLWFQIVHIKSGFNKEIIHFAALSLLLLLLKRSRLSSFGATLYVLVAAVFCVLSHEGLIFYAPYFFAALVVGGRSMAQAAKECLPGAIAALIATWFCTQHPGNMAIASGICSSLGYKFSTAGSVQVCGSGAIPYLIHSKDFARAETLANMHTYHYLLIFPIFALLALLPAAGESLVLARSRFTAQLSAVWGAVAISFLATLILFYYAYDWNRWIYIHIASLSILLLALDGRTQSSQDVVSDAQKSTLSQRLIAVASLGVYFLVCLIPNGLQSLRLGWLGRLTH